MTDDKKRTGKTPDKHRQEQERLAELFRKIEPDHRDDEKSEPEGNERPWRSVDEYREAQRLKRELEEGFDDLDLDPEEPDS